MKITHINPDELFKSPAFSQAVMTGWAMTAHGITANSEPIKALR